MCLCSDKGRGFDGSLAVCHRTSPQFETASFRNASQTRTLVIEMDVHSSKVEEAAATKRMSAATIAIGDESEIGPIDPA